MLPELLPGVSLGSGSTGKDVCVGRAALLGGLCFTFECFILELNV